MNFWRDPNLNLLLEKLTGVLAIIVGALVLWWLLSRGARRTRRHYEQLMSVAMQSRNPEAELADVQRRLTALRLVVNATKYFLSISALLMVLRAISPDIGLSLLLPAGFLGAALGLGAQNLVRDVVAGLFIVFEGQFAVGDVVNLNTVLGTVEEVGLRVTRVRDDSGQIHYFPNGAITAVSKFPKRVVPLQLWVPLMPNASSEQAAVIVQKVLDSFNAHAPNTLSEMQWQRETNAVDKVLSSPPSNDQSLSSDQSPSSDQSSEEPVTGDVQWLCWTFFAHPARAPIVREKLAGRLSATLVTAGFQMPTGAAIEIMTAPASL